jgi:hypothetical protein
MFNEKALRNRNRQRAANNKGSGFDPLDQEAEREGNARRFFKTNEVVPQLGRRIAKQNRQLDGNGKTAELKGTRHIVKETFLAAEAITIRPLYLRQG